MRGIKIGLATLAIPLLLAGCGQQSSNNKKDSSSSSSSMKMSGSDMKHMKGMKMSSSDKKDQSKSSKTADSAKKLEYKEPKLKSYKPISNDEITEMKMHKNTGEKEFSAKYSIPGKLTKLGSISGGYQNMLVTGSNGQKYLVTIKKAKAKGLKNGQNITVYGSGLTKITGPENGTGISSSELGKNAMDFSAVEIAK